MSRKINPISVHGQTSNKFNKLVYRVVAKNLESENYEFLQQVLGTSITAYYEIE